MNLRKQHVTGLTFAALFLATGSLVLAQEQKPFSPALEQLRETVSERLQTVADRLGLTPVTCCFRRFMMRSPKERFGNSSVGKTQPQADVEQPLPAGCRTLDSTEALAVVSMVAGAHRPQARGPSFAA